MKQMSCFRRKEKQKTKTLSTMYYVYMYIPTMFMNAGATSTMASTTAPTVTTSTMNNITSTQANVSDTTFTSTTTVTGGSQQNCGSNSCLKGSAAFVFVCDSHSVYIIIIFAVKFILQGTAAVSEDELFLMPEECFRCQRDHLLVVT